jgi:hypothetical protein
VTALYAIIQRLLDRGLAWRRDGPFKMAVTSDLPRVLVPGVVYVLGENGYRWSAAFRCPCGCGATVQLNLLPEARPRWTLTVHDDRSVSLRPSVWRNAGCRSHFVMRHGRIEWCDVSSVPAARCPRGAPSGSSRSSSRS